MESFSSDAKKKELIRSVKFVLFSISAGVIQFASFTLMQLFTAMPYWPCYLISLALSVVYNFTVNRRFTFQSAANIPLAMFKVFAYYCVFTPLSTIVGSWLVDVLGWNAFLVELLSMLVNFVTEFLFTRFLVYGKDVDSNKAYLEKHKDEERRKIDGPVISRTAIVICAIATVISAAVIAAVLMFGYRPDDRLVGSWISYYNGETVTYSYDGSKATFSDSHGNTTEYDYTVSGDTITLTNGKKTMVYLWTPDAVDFIADHEYGEARQLEADQAGQTENFKGYAYVKSDFLYIGTLCMCREDKLDGFTDTSLEGEWLGAAGDRLSFDADGGYHYKECGLSYDGTYEIDEDADKLTLTLSDDTIVYEDEQWGVSGRVFHINNQYYFRMTD